MNGFTWTVIIVLTLGSIGTILSIGDYRPPESRGSAALKILFNVLIGFWLIWADLHHWRY